MTTATYKHGELTQQNDLQKAIHRPHWQERLEIIEALSKSAYASDLRTAARLSACGQSARLWLDPEHGKVVTILTRCGVRICPWCTHHRTARAKFQILAIMKTMTFPRTIVLTARSTNRPLADQLTKLRQDFRRLRKNKRWNELVTGGVYTLEVTYNPRSRTWHPHVHLIVDGRFFPQPLLSSLWKQATTDSEIVWIHKVDDGNRAAMELAGYIGKPPKIKELPSPRLVEYVHATAGLRMLQTFGRTRSQPGMDKDVRSPPPAPEACLTLNRIRYLAKAGQLQALELSQLIPARWPIYLPFFNPAAPAPDPPNRSTPAQDLELLDAAIFCQFEQLLTARTAGLLDVYDIYSQL